MTDQIALYACKYVQIFTFTDETFQVSSTILHQAPSMRIERGSRKFAILIKDAKFSADRPVYYSRGSLSEFSKARHSRSYGGKRRSSGYNMQNNFHTNNSTKCNFFKVYLISNEPSRCAVDANILYSSKYT